MTREDIRSLFGEADAIGRGFAKRSLMGIWKFGVIEFHFDSDGKLFLIYSEGEGNNPRVIAQDPH